MNGYECMCENALTLGEGCVFEPLELHYLLFVSCLTSKKKKFDYKISAEIDHSFPIISNSGDPLKKPVLKTWLRLTRGSRTAGGRARTLAEWSVVLDFLHACCWINALIDQRFQLNSQRSRSPFHFFFSVLRTAWNTWTTTVTPVLALAAKLKSPGKST